MSNAWNRCTHCKCIHFFADFSCHHFLISKKLGFVPEGQLFWFESVAHDSSCIQKRFGCVRLTCELSCVQPVIVGAQIGPITCNMAIRGLKESDVDCWCSRSITVVGWTLTVSSNTVQPGPRLRFTSCLHGELSTLSPLSSSSSAYLHPSTLNCFPKHNRGNVWCLFPANTLPPVSPRFPSRETDRKQAGERVKEAR